MRTLRCYISENSRFTPAVFHCQAVVKYIELRYDGEASSAQGIFIGETCWETEKTGNRMHDDSAIHKLSMDTRTTRIKNKWKIKIKKEVKHYISNGGGRGVKGPKP